MHTQEQLKAMNVAEQKAYAKDIGVEIKGNVSEDTIIQRIMDKQLAPDFIDPNPAPEVQADLEGRELVDTQYTLTSGVTHSGHEVLEAAQRDSGLSVEDWNALKPEERQELVQVFVDQTNFKPTEFPKEEVKTDKGHKKRLEAIMADEFPEIGFEVEDNFWTMTYQGKIKSGNIETSDTILRREANVYVMAE